MHEEPNHRDWVLFRANASSSDPFFYQEFQKEIERCRNWLKGPGLDQVMQDLRIDLENRKVQALLNKVC